MVTIRGYRPGDGPAIDEVCLLTGHAGRDARPYYRDPDLLPDVFARPYLAADPALAFVADDGGRAVGYIVGVADTARFVTWYRRTWLPSVAARYPAPAPVLAPEPDCGGPDGGGPAGGGPDGSPVDWQEVMTRALHDPERMLRPELVEHPAHLHVNLHPGYQRQGLGGRLLAAFLEAVGRRGAGGVHVAHGKYNISARVFYRRRGFTRIPVDDPDPVVYLGRRVSAEPSIQGTVLLPSPHG